MERRTGDRGLYRDLFGAKSFRRLSSNQRSVRGPVWNHDDGVADAREVFRECNLARLRRAGRRIRPHLFHRHNGGGRVSRAFIPHLTGTYGGARVFPIDRGWGVFWGPVAPAAPPPLFAFLYYAP